jgi:uncharacterized membrane protein YqhA
MNKFLTSTRYLVLIAVLALLVTALAAFGWGVLKTVDAIGLVVAHAAAGSVITIALIEVMDAFLVAGYAFHKGT